MISKVTHLCILLSWLLKTNYIVYSLQCHISLSYFLLTSDIIIFCIVFDLVKCSWIEVYIQISTWPPRCFFLILLLWVNFRIICSQYQHCLPHSKFSYILDQRNNHKVCMLTYMMYSIINNYISPQQEYRERWLKFRLNTRVIQ